MATPLFYGIFAAVATPFKEGKIDEKAFSKHVLFLLDGGVSGVVPCGTTGESVALSAAERGRLIQLSVELCQGRAHVVPGTGAPTLEEALAHTRQAQELGVSGALVVTPYYVKADAEGTRDYYQKLHDGTDLPLLLYNNPGRTGVELSLALIERLATDAPRVCGLKDASTDLSRPVLLRESLGENFSLLSGEDPTFGAFLAQGGDGVISVGANVLPQVYRRFWDHFQKGERAELALLRGQLMQLSQLLFQAPSPGPLKYALSLMGYGDGTTRLPLGPLSRAHRERIEAFLHSWKLCA